MKKGAIMADKWIEAAAKEIMDRADAGVCITRDFAAIIQRHYDVAAKCRYPDCDNGRITYRGATFECPQCGGSGKVVPNG